MKPEINMNQFYKFGIICFSVIALMNLLNLIRIWTMIHPLVRVSTSFSIIFNIVIVLFFNHLRNSQPALPEEQMPKPEELEEYLEGLN